MPKNRDQLDLFATPPPAPQARPAPAPTPVREPAPPPAPARARRPREGALQADAQPAAPPAPRQSRADAPVAEEEPPLPDEPPPELLEESALDPAPDAIAPAEPAVSRTARWIRELPTRRGAAVKAAIRAQLGVGAPADLRIAEPRRAVYSVRELAARIRGSLEERFGTVNVRGEISNLRQPATGHVYFSLKDEGACLRAVMFRREARALKFALQQGQEVVVRGRVSFYDASGDAQIVCESIEPVGAGALALAFEQLKERLSREGLFDADRKRPLPYLPRRVGVVTSPGGAAIRDFVRVLHRRFPRIEVIIAPARVQGEGAAAEIVAGIQALCARGDCDLLVVTRGGGSIEDLWPFNEEIVARAIVAATVPVVSAVGHEVDTTIADFVADLRAPTPTGAAELIAPVEADLRAALAVMRTRLRRGATVSLQSRRAWLHRLRTRLGDPRRAVGREHLRLSDLEQRASAGVRRAVQERRRVLRGLQTRLASAHPAARLKLQERRLASLRDRLERAETSSLSARAERLAGLHRRLREKSPMGRVLREGRILGERIGRLEVAQARVLESRRAELSDLRARLRSLSPVAVLARGYAVAFRESGEVLTSAGDAREGEKLHLELAEGALEVVVVGTAFARKP